MIYYLLDGIGAIVLLTVMGVAIFGILLTLFSLFDKEDNDDGA